MKTITVINGTNRPKNNTLKVSKAFLQKAKELDFKTNIIDLTNWAELFKEYITLDNATEGQKKDIQKMSKAHIIIIITPTYHHSIPGSLKNFLDCISEKSAWRHKIVGLVSSSNNADAVKALELSLNGYLSYTLNGEEVSKTFIAPAKAIINNREIDEERVTKYIKYLNTFNISI